MNVTDNVLRSMGMGRVFKVRAWEPASWQQQQRRDQTAAQTSAASSCVHALVAGRMCWVLEIIHGCPMRKQHVWVWLLAVHLQDFQARVNSIDFHRTEELLITASDDDSIRLYNTASGDKAEVLFSRKYGAQNICFTHHPSSVIYATRKVWGCWSGVVVVGRPFYSLQGATGDQRGVGVSVPGRHWQPEVGGMGDM